MALPHLLIVEDDPVGRELLRAFLEAEGYEIACAGDGRAALDWLRSGAALPALILLDLTMPVLSGPEFRREQLNDARLAAIPVIIFSGDNDVAEIASQLDALDAFPKPIDLEELLLTLRRHFAR